MVQLGKLWGDGKFTSLSPLSKLLYSYLISQPSISTLGILNLNFFRLNIDLGYPNKNEASPLIDSLGVLEELGFILLGEDWDFDSQGNFIVLVKDHYKSLPKSKSIIRKATDEMSNSDNNIKKLLKCVFRNEDFELNDFVPPSPQEVSDYAASLGFAVDGKRFVEYYEDNDWYDKNNKKVRAWKAKVRKVWCREENRIKTVKGAPKGFENFFIEIEGLKIYPESWKGGWPSHSNFIYAEYLIQEFNNVLNEQRNGNG